MEIDLELLPTEEGVRVIIERNDVSKFIFSQSEDSDSYPFLTQQIDGKSYCDIKLGDLLELDLCHSTKKVVLNDGATHLCSIKENKFSKALACTDYHEFSMLVQNPAFRVNDPRFQYIASIYVGNNTSDKILVSACAVVASYRYLDDPQKNHFLESYCNLLISRSLGMFSEIEEGLELRWLISTNLAAAYFYTVLEDIDIAVGCLKKIVRQKHTLISWPSMATNYLIATYVLSFLKRFCHFETSLSLEDLFFVIRAVLPEAKYTHVAQFAETANAMYVAAECYLLFTNDNNSELLGSLNRMVLLHKSVKYLLVEKYVASNTDN